MPRGCSHTLKIPNSPPLCVSSFHPACSRQHPYSPPRRTPELSRTPPATARPPPTARPLPSPTTARSLSPNPPTARSLSPPTARRRRRRRRRRLAQTPISGTSISAEIEPLQPIRARSGVSGAVFHQSALASQGVCESTGRLQLSRHQWKNSVSMPLLYKMSGATVSGLPGASGDVRSGGPGGPGQLPQLESKHAATKF